MTTDVPERIRRTVAAAQLEGYRHNSARMDAGNALIIAGFTNDPDGAYTTALLVAAALEQHGACHLGECALQALADHLAGVLPPL